MAQPNGYEDLLGWSVGRFSWLDDEASKVNRYWRAIEYGSTYWLGKTIVGLWSDQPGVNPRPPGRNELRGPGLAAMGADSMSKFVPFFATVGADMQKASRAALMFYLGISKGARPTNAQLAIFNGKNPSDNRRIFFWLMTKAPANRFPFVGGVIGKAVKARDYYGYALQQFGDPVLREVSLLQRGIDSLMGASQTKDVTTPYGLRAARASAASETDTTPKSGRRTGESRRMDASGGLATVTTSVMTQDFIRTGGGHFTNQAWRMMIVEVNQQMASEFQLTVVDLMTNAQPHRRPTGDLIRATASPRNRIPT